MVRRAIRDEQKLALNYRDELGRATERTIRPIALIYYSHYANIVGWCELRQAIRNFRSDRVEHCEAAGAFFRGEGDGLREEWMNGWAEDRLPSHPNAETRLGSAGRCVRRRRRRRAGSG